MTALYLERFMNYGLTPEELRSGKHIIRIARSGSDFSPCNRIHIELAKRVRDGIRDAGGIATTSLKYARHFKRHSQAGMVMVNLPTVGEDYHVPFGGRKGSSFWPREQGRYAAEFFTTVKTA